MQKKPDSEHIKTDTTTLHRTQIAGDLSYKNQKYRSPVNQFPDFPIHRFTGSIFSSGEIAKPAEIF